MKVRIKLESFILCVVIGNVETSLKWDAWCAELNKQMRRKVI